MFVLKLLVFVNKQIFLVDTVHIVMLGRGKTPNYFYACVRLKKKKITPKQKNQNHLLLVDDSLWDTSNYGHSDREKINISVSLFLYYQMIRFNAFSCLASYTLSPV